MCISQHLNDEIAQLEEDVTELDHHTDSYVGERKESAAPVSKKMKELQERLEK